MQHFLLPTLAKAQACAAFVDAAMGYPVLGVNVGGGRHVAARLTQTYWAALKHPTLSQWSYVATPEAIAALGPQAVVLALPVPAPLDASWVLP